MRNPLVSGAPAGGDRPRSERRAGATSGQECWATCAEPSHPGSTWKRSPSYAQLHFSKRPKLDPACSMGCQLECMKNLSLSELVSFGKLNRQPLRTRHVAKMWPALTMLERHGKVGGEDSTIRVPTSALRVKEASTSLLRAQKRGLRLPTIGAGFVQRSIRFNLANRLLRNIYKQQRNWLDAEAVKWG